MTQMRIPFRIVKSLYRERLKQNVVPAELALEHAEGKARQAQVPQMARFVMGADTVVACEGRILGKPSDEKAAVRMIQLLSGRTNEVVTGIALLDRKTGILTRAAAHSWVAIKKMNVEECFNYVRESHPYDKAGGYAIQGKPRIARRVRGSFSNVVGFPRELVRKLLNQAGFFVAILFFISAIPMQQLFAVESSPVRSKHTEASLISEYTAVQPGKPLRIALRLKTDPDWHTYWMNSGDSGLATSIRWNLPEGFSAGAIQWPYPSLIRQDPLVTYGYQGEVWLFTTIKVPENLQPGSQVILRAKADWLECEIPCLPGRADLSLELTVNETAQVSLAWQRGAAQFLKRLPKPEEPEGWTFEQVSDALTLNIYLAADEAYFFPYEGELFDHAAPQVLTRTDGGLSLELQRSRLNPGPVQALAGVLLVTLDGQRQAYELKTKEKQARPAGGAPISQKEKAEKPITPLASKQELPPPLTESETKSFFERGSSEEKPIPFFLALVFAFLGGLILNLMPCVLPVLSLKVLGFVTQRGDVKQLRAHGLIWTAGVLVSFWILSGVMLALRWGGSSLGWGFHLQSPGMVAALTVIFLLLTLNMAGFFEVGLLLTRFAGMTSKAGEKNGQAFAAGVLAVVAATPCTAPFMGVAVGYSLTQTVPVVFAVFTFLGLGMAFPFLGLSFLPGGLKFLPKPGPWMDTFKRFLALPLGLTVIWLLWVLAVQVNELPLKWIAGALTVTAFSAFFYGRCHRSALAGDSGARSKSLFFLIVVMLSAGLAVFAAARGGNAEKSVFATEPKSAMASSSKGVQWRTFSREEAERLVLEGKPVFINFTARWCLSCQVNDRLVFQTQAVAEAFQARGVHAFKADWTSQDAVIAEALADYGRASVPVYVYYDGQSQQPRFLPEVLTVNLVLESLK